MDRLTLTITVLGLGLVVGACADMRGDDMSSPPPMEPAAGPDTGMGTQEPGMTEGRMGDMMDTDDQEGTESGAATGGGTTQ